METARLSLRNLGKSYSLPVLQNVNLSVASGEVHAIVGENGAGKSTLVNILAGLVAKSEGEIYLDGTRYEPSGPKDAFVAGLSFVAQELSIVSTLSVAENIGLKNFPRKGSVIRGRELKQQAERLLHRVGLPEVSANAPGQGLSLAERQLLELAKALAMDCRLLVLDEPTSALAAPQADRLHEIIKELTAVDTSVIYISHRLDDVMRISDTVTVLRDGQVAASVPTCDTSVAELLEKMTGQNDDVRKDRHYKTPGRERVLEVDCVTTAELPDPVSFNLYKGEVVGIAGLAGSGRSELLQALFGLSSRTGGCITRYDDNGAKSRIRSASHAVTCGIGFLGEDRQALGVFAGQSVLTNITLPGLGRMASALGVVDRRKEQLAVLALAEKLEIRCTSVHQDIEQLSGGNQQKALIARWLHCDSDIFLLDEPTRGIDVGSKRAIYNLLYEMQSLGKTLLVASSEIDELMTVCGRILVLSDRKLVKEFVRGDWSEKRILQAAFQEYVPGTLARNMAGPDNVQPENRG